MGRDLATSIVGTWRTDPDGTETGIVEDGAWQSVTASGFTTEP
jgi:hypothetical protein